MTSLLLVLLATTATTALATAPAQNGSIVFRRYLGPNRTNGAIFVIAPDGSGERRVSTAPSGLSDDFPDFAADGSFVAFQRCGVTCRVYTVRTDGTGVRQVGAGCSGGQRPPRCSDNSYPAISPDGKRIAFVRAFGRYRKPQIDHVGIYVVRVDGSHLRRVTLPPKRAAEDNQPQWSPDGRQIVFVRNNVTAKPNGQQAIFVVDADGSHLRRVTPWSMRAGDGPDWSPDGTQILFRSPETGNFLNSNLFTIHPDGAGLRQITNVSAGTKVYSSSFSPDGTSITVGMSGVDGAPDVYAMHADGTALTPVTRTAQWDSAPDWGGLKTAARAVATVASLAATPEVRLRVRAADLTRSADGSWAGAVVSPQLGGGHITLTGKVAFRPDAEPSRGNIRFRVTFKKGWLRGCVRNTVLLRPGDRYVWDGPGRITSTSASLRRYRGIRVYSGGLTTADDLAHAKPFGFSSPAPPQFRHADIRC